MNGPLQFLKDGSPFFVAMSAFVALCGLLWRVLNKRWLVPGWMVDERIADMQARLKGMEAECAQLRAERDRYLDNWMAAVGQARLAITTGAAVLDARPGEHAP